MIDSPPLPIMVPIATTEDGREREGWTRNGAEGGKWGGRGEERMVGGDVHMTSALRGREEVFTQILTKERKVA